MASGTSIHIGVNAVDTGHYGSTLPVLKGCEKDAAAMADLARHAGFDVREPLLGRSATVQTVSEAIRAGMARTDRGDLLLITYAGHGGRVPDGSGDDGYDGLDETWCLYDRQLIDDELYALWTEAKPGARILVISDSCYSGSVIRDAQTAFGDDAFGGGFGTGGGDDFEDDYGPDAPRTYVSPSSEAASAPGSRGMSESAVRDIFERNAPTYQAARTGSAAKRREPLKASVLLLSASADWQPARESNGHGVFTAAVIEAWRNGAFTGGYHEFHADILTRVRSAVGDVQTPGYSWASGRNDDFLRQMPFFIDEPTSAARSIHRHARGG